MKHEGSNAASSFKFQASGHIPVLLQEAIEFLDPKSGNFVIDGTVGSGGHAAEILKRILPDGKLLGIDWDKLVFERARERISAEIENRKSNIKNNLILVCGNYADLAAMLSEHSLPKADGVLLDLGFSSEQLEASGRGFSFRPSACLSADMAGGDEPLVMTYSDERPPVRDILRQMNVVKLEEIIRTFGEEKYAAKVARAIKEREKTKRIETSGELAEVVARALPAQYERGRIHPATRTFQALRIYANDELGNLERLLNDLPLILAAGGRAVIISYHSLEDRLVKNHFRKYEKDGVFNVLTKKPIPPAPEEIAENPRSRSAKLRAAIRT